MKNKPSTSTAFIQSLDMQVFIAILLVMFITCWSCTDAAGKKVMPENSASTATTTTTAASPIDGNWELVWSKDTRTGQVDERGKPSQFKTFQNGFFSMLAWDVSGTFSYAGYGTFELQGTKYKETVIWHNTPEYIGGYDWQTYELKGDTLYFRGFDQVVIGGKDVTADFGKFEEKRVRAK